MTGLAERLADLASGVMLENAHVTGCSRVRPVGTVGRGVREGDAWAEGRTGLD
jgi:hypothetical protein